MFKKIISKKGFTLLEILLVVGIIAILAAIVIIAINPGRQLAQVRNTERLSNLKQIYNAMQQYYIDYGTYPGTIPTSLTEICNTGATTTPHSIDCTGLVDLSALVPVYIVAIPTDPQGAISLLDKLISTVYAAPQGSGYQIMKDSNNKVALAAPKAELNQVLTLGPVVLTATGPLGDGLIAHYKMNDTGETTTIVDTKGHNGTTQRYASVLTTTGKIGNAIKFDRAPTNDKMLTSLNYGNDQDWSIAMWVYYESTSGGWSTGLFENAKLVGQQWSGIYCFFYGNQLGNRDKLDCQCYGNGSLHTDPLTSTRFTPPGWYHVVITYKKDTKSFKMYVDNQLHVDTTLNDYLGIGDDTFTIGGADNDIGIESLQGKLDDVRIYNRVLTADEVGLIYNNGEGTEAE